MSMFLARPQKMERLRLNIGDIYNRPGFLTDKRTSPGVDTEIIEEVPDTFDALLYDQGDDAGFVEVNE